MTGLEICSGAACFTVNPDRSSPARAIGRILEVDSAELMVTARALAAQQAGANTGGVWQLGGNGYTDSFDGPILAAAATATLTLQKRRDLRLRSASALTEAAFGCEKKIQFQGQDGKVSTVQG